MTEREVIIELESLVSVEMIGQLLARTLNI